MTCRRRRSTPPMSTTPRDIGDQPVVEVHIRDRRDHRHPEQDEGRSIVPDAGGRPGARQEARPMATALAPGPRPSASTRTGSETRTSVQYGCALRTTDGKSSQRCRPHQGHATSVDPTMTASGDGDRSPSSRPVGHRTSTDGKSLKSPPMAASAPTRGSDRPSAQHQANVATKKRFTLPERTALAKGRYTIRPNTRRRRDHGP